MFEKFEKFEKLVVSVEKSRFQVLGGKVGKLIGLRAPSKCPDVSHS
jgi:hypothetical protein